VPIPGRRECAYVLRQKIRHTLNQLADGTVVNDPLLRQKIQEGVAFSVSRRFVGVADEDTGYMYFENPSESGKIIHLIIVEVTAFGQGHVDVYRASTINNSGTQITPVNLNLGSGNQSIAYVEYNGSYTPGNKVHETVAPGGTKVRAIGSLVEVGEEVYIPPGYNLLVGVTNKAGTASDFSIRILWWEE